VDHSNLFRRGKASSAFQGFDHRVYLLMVGITVVFEDPAEALKFFRTIMSGETWEDCDVSVHIHGDKVDMDAFHEFMTQDVAKSMLKNIEEFLEEQEQ
jgi:hypothetical protein